MVWLLHDPFQGPLARKRELELELIGFLVLLVFLL